MSPGRGHEPTNLSNLERWLFEWAGAVGVSPGRLRRRVAVLAVAGMLDGLRRDDDDGPAFVVKGGSALELRFGFRARTSKDLDATYRGNVADAAGLVAAAVEVGWHGFAGRVVDVEEIAVPGMTLRPVRFKIKLAFRGKPYATLPMEVSGPEGGALDDIDTVVVAPLDPLGLPAPETVPCLSVRYQVAQKLHACTDPLDGEPNDRVHDLADLMLLDELLTQDDLRAVHHACVDIFTLRNRQPWPPALTAADHWPGLWRRLVDDDAFPVESLDDAISHVRDLIIRIDAAH
jgi:hypothetical protein